MKLVKEHIILEKFTEESDPIRDLGIGMPALRKIWREKLREIGQMSCPKIYDDFFPDKTSENNRYKDLFSMCLYDVLNVLATNHSAYPREALTSGLKYIKRNYNASKTEVNNVKHDIADILEKHFHTGKIKIEDINEKFTEESDPVRDMGIGGISLLDYMDKYVDPEDPKKVKWLNFLKKLFVGKTVTFTRFYGGNIVTRHVTGVSILDPEKIFFFFNDHTNWYVDINKRIFFNKEEEIIESLNEKFTEDSDPISDMGIGIKNRNFTSEEELYKFIINIIPIALGTKKIPENILKGTGCLNEAHFRKIRKFLDDMNIKHNGIRVNRYDSGPVWMWPLPVMEKLQEMGFKK